LLNRKWRPMVLHNRQEDVRVRCKPPTSTSPDHNGAVWLSRTGPASRQSESGQRHTRGDRDPLNAVEHVGDRCYTPNGSTGLEAPQLLATC